MCLLVIDILYASAMPVANFYSLSLHDALPISTDADDRIGRAEFAAQLRDDAVARGEHWRPGEATGFFRVLQALQDRKSTRLNSSHRTIPYAVFCLKKKKPPPSAFSLMCLLHIA